MEDSEAVNSTLSPTAHPTVDEENTPADIFHNFFNQNKGYYLYTFLKVLKFLDF